MTPRKHESETLPNVLVEEEVDYESDSNFASEQDSISDSPVRRDDIPRPPNPFLELGAANADTTLRGTPGIEAEVMTNKLDELQQQLVQAEEYTRLSFTTIVSDQTGSDYGYQPLSADERIRQVAG